MASQIAEGHANLLHLPPALFSLTPFFFSNLPSALERQELTYEKNKGAK